MKRSIAVLFAASCIAVPPAMSDEHGKPGSQDRTATAHRSMSDPGVTYGRIKEFNVAQKVVIDVDDAIDKTFNLAGRDSVVNMAAGLKVGDPVMVTERDVNGKKTVQIVKHSGGNVAHGDPDRGGRADREDVDANVTYGRVKEFAGGRILIDVDNAIDKEFTLADTDPKVNVAVGLKIGDPVKVTEREVNGKKTVHIVKHTSGNVTHGDADRKKDSRQ